MNSAKGASRGSGNIAWTLSRRLGMVIVLALAFFLSAIVTIYTLFRSGDTQVPNVIGRSETEAQKLAEQAGLRVKIQHRTDASIPANSVIETRHGANSSVKKDSVLTIVVSAGPQTKSELAPGPISPGRRHIARRFVINTRDSLKDLVGTLLKIAP
jgi:PASTA domain